MRSCSWGVYARVLAQCLDQHGHVAGEPMGPRSISATIAFRQTLGDVTEIGHTVPTFVPTGCFANATMSELADAYDDVDEQAAALLLRLKEIVGETDDMLNHIKNYSQ